MYTEHDSNIEKRVFTKSKMAALQSDSYVQAKGLIVFDLIHSRHILLFYEL
jgi:hypothetical protein